MNICCSMPVNAETFERFFPEILAMIIALLGRPCVNCPNAHKSSWTTRTGRILRPNHNITSNMSGLSLGIKLWWVVGAYVVCVLT